MLARTARWLDQQDLGFDRLDRLDEDLLHGSTGRWRVAVQHGAQGLREQVPEHLLWGRGVGRTVTLPARHVGQYLRAEAGEVEDDLGEIGELVLFHDVGSFEQRDLAPAWGEQAPVRA